MVGFHYLGPNAGEVTQGYGGMIKLGAKKADFDNLIGIHPTTAEVHMMKYDAYTAILTVPFFADLHHYGYHQG